MQNFFIVMCLQLKIFIFFLTNALNFSFAVLLKAFVTFLEKG